MSGRVLENRTSRFLETLAQTHHLLARNLPNHFICLAVDHLDHGLTALRHRQRTAILYATHVPDCSVPRPRRQWLLVLSAGFAACLSGRGLTLGLSVSAVRPMAAVGLVCDRVGSTAFDRPDIIGHVSTPSPAGRLEQDRIVELKTLRNRGSFSVSASDLSSPAGR